MNLVEKLISNQSSEKYKKKKSLNQNNRYFGEFNLSAVIKTHLEQQQFDSLFSEEGLRAVLTLETLDGDVHKVEVLDIEVNWEKF